MDKQLKLCVDTNVADESGVGDVMVTIGNLSFYVEYFDGKVIIRKYNLEDGVPVDDEGTVIFEGEVN